MKNSRMFSSASYAAFIFFFYFMLLREWLETQVTLFKYADELIALMGMLFFLINFFNNNCKMRGAYGRWIIIFVMLGMLGNIVYGYQPFVEAALPDMFLCVKFWLAIYAGKYFFQKFDIEAYAKQIYFHVRLVIWVYTLLIVIDNIFDIFSSVTRYGLRSTHLFYSQPTVFVAEGIFLLAILMMIYEKVNGSKKYMIWICILICTTLRSKAFGAVMAFAFIYYFVVIRKKRIRIRTLIMFVPLCVLLVWDQIEYYFFSSIQSDSARYQLLVNAVKIANDHFPLGSGFGTFASYYSGKIYSPLYDMYGISHVHGLVEGNTSFISDSFWPTILGQTGWLGLVCFGIALLLLLLKINKLRSFRTSFYLAAMIIFVYEIIALSAESAFFHPLAIQYAVLLGYMFSLSEKRTTANKMSIPAISESSVQTHDTANPDRRMSRFRHSGHL